MPKSLLSVSLLAASPRAAEGQTMGWDPLSIDFGLVVQEDVRFMTLTLAKRRIPKNSCRRSASILSNSPSTIETHSPWKRRHLSFLSLLSRARLPRIAEGGVQLQPERLQFLLCRCSDHQQFDECPKPGLSTARRGGLPAADHDRDDDHHHDHDYDDEQDTDGHDDDVRERVRRSDR